MAKTHEQFVNEILCINPNIEIIGNYTKSVERIKVRCKICGKIWQPKAYSLTQGKGCSHCSAKKAASKHSGKTKLKSHDEFVSEVKEIFPDIEIKSQYINNHYNVLCFCSRCQNNWEAKPYSLLQGHGCPRCAKSGTSFMEQFLLLSFAFALGDTEVISRDKNTIGMELDILIPSLKIAIEPGNWYLHKKSLERDKRKRELCFQNGIRLITIYDRFPDNETIPFQNDCITFGDDLNKSDHQIIRNLVCSLFNMLNIKTELSIQEFETIESQAYKLSKSKTHDDFVQQINKIHPDISVLDTYKNSNRRICVRCDKCGNIWKAVPANLLSGDGCKKCAVYESHLKFIKPHDLFVEQIKVINPNVEILEKYSGRHNPIKTKCLICGYTWYPRASSLLRGSNHKGYKSLHKSLNK